MGCFVSLSTTFRTTSCASASEISTVAGVICPLASTFTGTVTTLPSFSTVTVPTVGTGTSSTEALPSLPVVAAWDFPSLSTMVTVALATLLPLSVTLTSTLLFAFFLSSILLGWYFSSCIYAAKSTYASSYPAAEARTLYIPSAPNRNATSPLASVTLRSVPMATSAPSMGPPVCLSTTVRDTTKGLTPMSIVLGEATPSAFTSTRTVFFICTLLTSTVTSHWVGASTLGTTTSPFASVTFLYMVPSASAMVTSAPNTLSEPSTTCSVTSFRAFFASVITAGLAAPCPSTVSSTLRES